jgi:hypothetical protein
LLALLGAHPIFHISRIKVNRLKERKAKKDAEVGARGM